MLTSVHCQKKISEFKYIQGLFFAAISPLENCIDKVDEGALFMENDSLKISGNSIDNGKLKDLSDSLESSRNIFIKITKECSDKIIKYEELKREALAYEEMIRKQREKANEKDYIGG